MRDRETIRRSELLAIGYIRRHLRVLTEYIALEGKTCCLSEEVADAPGHAPTPGRK